MGRPGGLSRESSSTVDGADEAPTQSRAGKLALRGREDVPRGPAVSTGRRGHLVSICPAQGSAGGAAMSGSPGSARTSRKGRSWSTSSGGSDPHATISRMLSAGPTRVGSTLGGAASCPGPSPVSGRLAGRGGDNPRAEHAGPTFVASGARLRDLDRQRRAPCDGGACTYPPDHRRRRAELSGHRAAGRVPGSREISARAATVVAG